MAKKNKEIEAVEEPVVKVSEELPHKPIMYVGPTLAKYALTQNVVYTDIPDNAKPLFDELPIARVLLIDVQKYPEAEKSIREQAGIYWTAYKEIRKRG